MSLTSTDSLTTNRLEEWKAARSLLKDFDDRISDLRKYGFTVVTALLAINSFLLPSSIGGKDALTDQVKLAAIGSMMLLIVALRYVERSYRLFQDAVAGRARILERVMNFELTEKISERYKRSFELSHTDLVYFFFLVAVFGLGLAVVSQTLSLSLNGYITLGLLVAFSIIPISQSIMLAKSRSARTRTSSIRVRVLSRWAWALSTFRTSESRRAKILRLGRWLVDFSQRVIDENLVTSLYVFGFAILGVKLAMLYLFFHLSEVALVILSTLVSFLLLASLAFIVMAQRLSPTWGKGDWTVDRVQCKVGEPINVMVTNLGDESKFLPSSNMFEVQTLDGILVGGPFTLPADPDRKLSSWIYEKKPDKSHLWLGNWDSYTWTWDTSNVSQGIYRIVPYERRNERRVLGAPLPQKIMVTSDRQKFQVSTTDGDSHECLVTNWAEAAFLDNRFDLIACTTHKRSLAECLRVKQTKVTKAKRDAG
ncbi:MAG TPA: hypothetical protein VGS11_07345 [Candidatus Bathyarchaeia archaeon]|nr:hypothetical protein [Candidatus Bathyarchaeia archaeon]